MVKQCLGPVWPSRKVYNSLPGGRWFKPHWILWLFHGSDSLGNALQSPSLSTSETQEVFEFVSRCLDMSEIVLKVA